MVVNLGIDGLVVVCLLVRQEEVWRCWIDSQQVTYFIPVTVKSVPSRVVALPYRAPSLKATDFRTLLCTLVSVFIGPTLVVVVLSEFCLMIVRLALLRADRQTYTQHMRFWQFLYGAAGEKDPPSSLNEAQSAFFF